MMFQSFLNSLFKLIPETPPPSRRLRLGERLFWTALILVLYLAMSQVPLYGIHWSEQGYQPLLLFQVVMASRRGTLMELGIGPLVTAGIIWQLLVGSGLIELDLSTREGRRIYAGIQKVLTLIFAVIEAVGYIWGGAYGTLSLLSQVIVLIQLVMATLVVMLMDDMLEKGWGIGSAVSLFIAAGVAQQVFWEMFSPVGPVGDGLFVGLVPSIFHSAFTYASTGNGTLLLQLVARRSGYPDLLGFISMIALLFALTYLESMRIEIPVSATRYGGVKAKVPLKFLYVSNLPVILVSAVYANVYIVARAVWSRFNPDNSNPWLNLLVKYNSTEGQLIPLKPSLVYYLTTPRGIWTLLEDPLHVLIYALMFISLCVIFSLIWVAATGMDPSAQAEQLVKAELQIPGFRSSTKILESMLSTYVWPLAVLSGATVGVIAVISDILGTLGSGIGILLVVGIMIQYQQLLLREQLTEMYPSISRILGR